jgi:hypothetical protein
MMVTMKRGRSDLGDKPWVAIATVAGFVAVIIIALVFYLGNPGGGLYGTEPQEAQGSTSIQNSTEVSTPGSSSVISELTTIAIPVTGVWVRVSYIGSYTGIYGVNGNLQKIDNSGDRVFEVQKPEGNITAVFTKEDSSTRHEILVEIYKDGTILKSGENSSAYGEVSLIYQL